MAYIGVQPTAGQYRKLDNISASFNGSTTSFTTSVGGTNVTAGTAQQLIVSLGGVIQQPDSDYTVSTNTITFTTAPTSGLDFFAILMGDALNTVTPSDGSVTTSKLAGSLSIGLTAGSASTPALFFTGDTNNGIFSPSTDAIAVTTAGSERLRVTSAGLVGIGTSSPSQKMHLEDSGSNVYLRVTETGNTGIDFGQATDGNGVINLRDNAAIQILTNNAERVRINSTGVGIGTTSPVNSLVVSNGGAFGFEFDTSGGYLQTYNRSGAAYADLITRSATVQFRIENSEKARIDSSGRLLVGTSSSNSTFSSGIQIAGTAADATSLISRFTNGVGGPVLYLAKSRSGTIGTNTLVQSDDELGTIDFRGANGSGYDAGARIASYVDGTPGASGDMPGRLVFSTTADGASSPTERGRFTSVGYLKCANSGTYLSSSAAYHEFNNNAADHTMRQRNTNGSDPYGLRIDYTNDPNNTGSEFLYCASATSTLRASIRSNGGLANYQANNVNLSDINTKKDISPAAGTWDCIKEWEIVNYRYKDQPDDADLSLGVIAQQVAESCPEVITVFQKAKEATDTEPAQEERLGIKEQQMYWMAIKALQEAQVRIEALEAEVAALKAQ